VSRPWFCDQIEGGESTPVEEAESSLHIYEAYSWCFGRVEARRQLPGFCRQQMALRVTLGTRQAKAHGKACERTGQLDRLFKGLESRSGWPLY
jgi:hypothetical protein